MWFANQNIMRKGQAEKVIKDYRKRSSMFVNADILQELQFRGSIDDSLSKTSNSKSRYEIDESSSFEHDMEDKVNDDEFHGYTSILKRPEMNSITPSMNSFGNFLILKIYQDKEKQNVYESLGHGQQP